MTPEMTATRDRIAAALEERLALGRTTKRLGLAGIAEVVRELHRRQVPGLVDAGRVRAALA